MGIDADSAFKAVMIILESNEGHKTAMGSLQSCLITAVSTFAGSMFGGPKGIIPGALLGSACAYFMKKDSYKSIVEVIENDLSPRQKAELTRNVQQVMAGFVIADVAMLMNMAAQDVNFQKEVLSCVSSFVSSQVDKNALNI